MNDDKKMQSPKDVAKLSPDRLTKRFRESKIVACLFVALALHVVVLGATSVDYIHGLVDPVWKDEQVRIADDARKAKAAKQAQAARPAATAATKPAAAPDGKAKPAPASAAPATTDRKLPPELTTMPKPGEIPVAPGGGIGVDEMEKK
jgi:uncharacterized membrane protein